MKKGRFVAGMTAAAFAAVMVSFAAAAEDPSGYVSFTAIKSAIGQGFTVVPCSVPLYEGDKGIDVVKRAVGEDGVVFTVSDYGEYVTGFADSDTGAELPEEIAAVCPEMTGRNTEGYLSAYDYTAESGWSYFVNGEYAQVGITDYEPKDGDVLEFRFTVYGYGADLGIDNSEWGGAAALVEQADASELIRACAEQGAPAAEEALEVLAKYGAAQAEIDAAAASIKADDSSDNAQSAPEADKGSPDTGVKGAAPALGAVMIACAALAVARKR